LVYYKLDGNVISLTYNFFITSRHNITGKLHTWHEATIAHSLIPNNPQLEQVQNQILSNIHSRMKLQILAKFYQENKTYIFVPKDIHIL
jgi:hypothetical protein